MSENIDFILTVIVRLAYFPIMLISTTVCSVYYSIKIGHKWAKEMWSDML